MRLGNSLPTVHGSIAQSEPDLLVTDAVESDFEATYG